MAEESAKKTEVKSATIEDVAPAPVAPAPKPAPKPEPVATPAVKAEVNKSTKKATKIDAWT